MNRWNVLVKTWIGWCVGWVVWCWLDWKGWWEWGEDVKSGWVGLELSCDWAIVCGVCYYPNLLQMQQIHPKPRPRLVITNSADNTCYHPNMALYHLENNAKWYWKPYFTASENTFHSYVLRKALFCVSPLTAPHSFPRLPTHHFSLY